jgi:FMN phosphatase YigB (HAD superfamily)
MQVQKYIALDVGNCCISVSNDGCLKKIGLKNIEDVPQSFLDVCAKFECGLISTEDWLCEFRKATKERFSDKELIDAWLSIVGEEIKGMPEALKEITDSGVRVIFLSDTSEIHIKHAITKMTLPVYVSGGVYSYEVGARKPSEKMFMAFEEKYARPILYTDDREENIAAAKALGWNAQIFKTSTEFIEAFRLAISKE